MSAAAAHVADPRKAVLIGAVREWPTPDPMREQVAVADAGTGRTNMSVVAACTDEQLAQVVNGIPKSEEFAVGAEGVGVMGLLLAIAQDAEALGVALGDDGLPEHPVDAIGQPSADRDSQARRLNRHTLQARAVGAELYRRSQQRQEAADRREATSRERLARVYAAIPSQAAELVSLAGEVGGAVERLRALARDLELASAGPGLWLQHQHLRDALARAAGALGKPMPDLAAMPPEPDFGEVRTYVLPLLLGSAVELLRSPRVPDARDASHVLEDVRVVQGIQSSR